MAPPPQTERKIRSTTPVLNGDRLVGEQYSGPAQQSTQKEGLKGASLASLALLVMCRVERWVTWRTWRCWQRWLVGGGER